MGVTITVDYKCHNRGVITELILHKHTCINRKVGVLDPPPPTERSSISVTGTTAGLFVSTPSAVGSTLMSRICDLLRQRKGI